MSSETLSMDLFRVLLMNVKLLIPCGSSVCDISTNSLQPFDIERVIHSLRIGYIPEGEEDQSTQPAIAVKEGGLHAAAALLWARYSISSQVYFHPVRRVYDMHLVDFIRICYPNGYVTESDKEVDLISIVF